MYALIILAPMVLIRLRTNDLPLADASDAPRCNAAYYMVALRNSLRRRLSVGTLPDYVRIRARIVTEDEIASSTTITEFINYALAAVSLTITVRIFVRSIADDPTASRYTLIGLYRILIRLVLTLYSASYNVAPSISRLDADVM